MGHLTLVPLLAAFGATLIALAQTNLRRMLAFSSISRVGLVVLGIASLNQMGMQGALFQLLNFTLVSGGLFLATGFLHHRSGSTELSGLGGAARNMPLLASFFLLLGLPGTSSFPAELLLILSALDSHTGAGLAALFGMILGAGYFDGVYRKAFFGPLVAEAQDLRQRELMMLVVLALVVLSFGLYPQLRLDFTRAAGQGWVARLGTSGA